MGGHTSGGRSSSRAHAEAPAPTAVSAPQPAPTQPASAAAPAQAVKYTCTMHPEVILDKPGRCPKCGMNLVPVDPSSTVSNEVAPAAGADAMEMEGNATIPAGPSSGGLVNVNTATLAELDAVNGIGAATAKKIIAYREAHGPLRSIDDLKAAEIHGCILGRIKNQITFTGGGAPAAASSAAGSPAMNHGAGSMSHGASSVTAPAVSSGPRTNINTATAAQIKVAVPRMSQATADAIVAARQSAGGKFTAWSQIDAIPGIGTVTLEKLNVAFVLR